MTLMPESAEAQMDLAAVTIVAKPELSLARVLARSLHRHHPEIPFHVLLADEVDDFFEPRAEPFTLLQMGDLAVPDRAGFVARYSRQELTYACTPFVLGRLLDLGYRRAAFFKQESLVFGDLTPVFDAMRSSSIVLTPHLLAPLTDEARIERESNILQSGVFNVGFIGVSATPSARRFLAWWQDRLREHCRRDVAAGLHFEQRWLDLVPAYFESIAVVRDPGFNVGHWNLPDRKVEIRGDVITVDGRPCRFVRFSGFEAMRPARATRYAARLTMDNLGAAAELFRRYAALLREAGYKTTRRWPYAYHRRVHALRELARRIRPLRRLRTLVSRVKRVLYR